MDSAGAKSVMSNDMKELGQGKEDVSNIIRGHKANLSNPSESLAGYGLSGYNVPVANRIVLRYQ